MVPESGGLGAGQQVDQRGLAGAVRADDADTVAALDADREVIDDLAVAIGTADVLGLENQLAGFFRLGGSQVGVAGCAAIVAALLAQLMQIGEPLDVALAAAGNAVAQPMLLVDDLAVELVLVALFFGEHLVTPGLESRKAAIDLPDLAAIEPGRGARQIRQKAAVMADEDQRAAAAGEFALQPFDGGEVEMVGRLVQQQDIGLGRQHPRQRRAPRFAAGEVGGILVAVQAELLQHEARLIMVVAGRRVRPRHRPASWRSRKNPAPAADSGWWRRAAQSGCPCRVRPGRRRSSAASTCRSRCARSGRRARPPTPRTRRRTTAACRQTSARYLSTGSAGGAMSFSLTLFFGGLRACGAGCGGWSDRAPKGMPSGRAARTTSGRR